ncbi:MAG: isochorismatase family protein [Clostridia bacterium]|nr:isochorismatase family protein [Clostridia bacterium]
MAARRLLVVVDYQRDLVEGPLGFAAAAALEAPLCEAARACAAEGGEVAFLLDTHEQKYLLTREGRTRPVKHAIKGTPGHELYGKVGRLAADLTSVQRRADGRIAPAAVLLEKPAAGGLSLAEYLQKERPYSVIELSGIDTQGSLLAAAVIAQAASPESEIRVDRRRVASADEEALAAALAAIARLGGRVVGDA